MFLLGLHIVAIGMLIVLVWGMAFRAGERKGERHARRKLGLDTEDTASDNS